MIKPETLEFADAHLSALKDLTEANHIDCELERAALAYAHLVFGLSEHGTEKEQAMCNHFLAGARWMHRRTSGEDVAKYEEMKVE